MKWLYNNYFIFELFFYPWKVFSPIPIKYDLRVFYRDLLDNNITTSIKEVELFYSKSFFLINISHRERLLLNLTYKNEKQESKTYKILKKCINKSEKKINVKNRQLTIVKSFGSFSEKENNIVLIDNI